MLQDDLHFYFSILVLPISLLLNVISARIFFSKSLNSNATNMGLLYGSLCSLNVFSLINMLTFNILDYIQYDYLYTPFLCIFTNFWAKAVLHLPSYQQVLIAFFLWLSIAHANKYKTAIRKTLYFNLAISVYVIVTNSFNFTYYLAPNHTLNTTSISNPNTTWLVCVNIAYLDYISDCINIINRAVLPCILIFVFNFMSMRRIAHRNKRFKDMAEKSSNFVHSVIGMNVAFLVIYFPWGVLFLVHHTANMVTNNSADYNASDFINLYWFQTLFAISDCISYFNSMAPFFLNLMCNSIFRREIQYLFGVSNANKISLAFPLQIVTKTTVKSEK